MRKLLRVVRKPTGGGGYWYDYQYSETIMVGGVVIGVTRLEGKSHINVADCPHSKKHERGQCPNPDTCCVYTDEINQNTGLKVEVKLGDSFWWQSGRCYWTPAENRKKEGAQGGIDYDIPLTKLGYSH